MAYSLVKACLPRHLKTSLVAFILLVGIGFYGIKLWPQPQDIYARDLDKAYHPAVLSGRVDSKLDPANDTKSEHGAQRGKSPYSNVLQGQEHQIMKNPLVREKTPQVSTQSLRLVVIKEQERVRLEDDVEPIAVKPDKPKSKESQKEFSLGQYPAQDNKLTAAESAQQSGFFSKSANLVSALPEPANQQVVSQGLINQNVIPPASDNQPADNKPAVLPALNNQQAVLPALNNQQAVLPALNNQEAAPLASENQQVVSGNLKSAPTLSDTQQAVPSAIGNQKVVPENKAAVLYASNNQQATLPALGNHQNLPDNRHSLPPASKDQQAPNNQQVALPASGNQPALSDNQQAAPLSSDSQPAGLSVLDNQQALSGNKPSVVPESENQQAVPPSTENQQTLSHNQPAPESRQKVLVTQNITNVTNVGIINPHNFRYIINNETACSSSEKLSYLVYFHSSPTSHVLRNILRKTWARQNLFPNHPSMLLFFIGKPKEDTIIDSIRNESKFHGDIIMEDYIDNYKNMTYKAISALRWINNFCKNVKFVIKADQDVYVNIFKAVMLLDTPYANKSKFFLCSVYKAGTMPILRDPKTCLKWCVPKNIFPGKSTYPTYCSGSAYIFTSDLAGDLYNASLYTPYFYIDDAYVTGLLPQKLGYPINHHSIGEGSYRIMGSNLHQSFETVKGSYDYFAVHDAYRNYQNHHWHQQLRNLPPEMSAMLGKERLEVLLNKTEDSWLAR